MAKNKDGDTTFLINDVSQRVGLSQKRLREYEKGGLISPQREPRTNNRRYSESDIKRILRVKELIHEHGFTVACLRYFLAKAPCWVIFNCAKKKDCPTYEDPRIPCYDMIKKANEPNRSANCQSCPVYLNRDLKTIALFNNP